LLTPPTIATFMPESLPVETRENLGKWLGRKSVDWLGAFQAREGAVDMVYDIPNTSFSQVVYDPGVPISIWRSVANSYNGFAVESFIDELAVAAGKDPLQFRRARLQQYPRRVAVLDKLEQLSGWQEHSVEHPQGVAIFDSFGTVVGQVVEVSVNDQGDIRVHKVTCVVDCGIAVSPNIVSQQMESGIIFGLTAALYGEINIDNGKVRQSNFHDYRMLRMADAPEIEVHIIDSDGPPGGVGEPATPVIAPAVANAVYAATGQRLRSLPLQLET
jgi:isoquinoline 1-oxidoreductase beta subunit